MMSYLILNTPGAHIKLRLPLTALATSCGFVGQFGSPNSKGVSNGCALGLFGGNIGGALSAVRA